MRQSSPTIAPTTPELRNGDSRWMTHVPNFLISHRLYERRQRASGVQCTDMVAVVDSGPSNLSSLRLQSSPWGCPDGLPDPNTARARPHRRPEGDGESSEGGRYRIWLLLGLVARHRRGNHSKYIGEGMKVKMVERSEKQVVGRPNRGKNNTKGPYRGKKSAVRI